MKAIGATHAAAFCRKASHVLDPFQGPFFYPAFVLSMTAVLADANAKSEEGVKHVLREDIANGGRFQSDSLGSAAKPAHLSAAGGVGSGSGQCCATAMGSGQCCTTCPNRTKKKERKLKERRGGPPYLHPANPHPDMEDPQQTDETPTPDLAR